MRASFLLVLIASVSIVSVGFKARYPGEIDLSVPKGYKAASKIRKSAEPADSWKTRADQAEAAALLAEQFETVQTEVTPPPVAARAAKKATTRSASKKASKHTLARKRARGAKKQITKRHSRPAKRTRNGRA